MMHYYLTMTYTNKAGKTLTVEIEEMGVKQDVLRKGAEYLAAEGLNYTAIKKALIRCPAWAGLGLGY